MQSDRPLRLFASLAFAVSLASVTTAQAIVVCRTPDGATYATDHPPPDCAAIPSSEIERFGAYSESEEVAPAAPPPVPPPAPPPVAEEPPPRTFEEAAPAYAPEPPRPRRDPEDGPESNRAHAMASCEQSVAEQLERPSSARWPNRGDYKVRESGGRYNVEGHVEAEQALGSSDIKWRCDAIYNGDRWIAVAELQKEAPPPAVAAAPAPGPAAYPPEQPSAREPESVHVSRAMPPPSSAPAMPPPAYAAPPPVAEPEAPSSGQMASVPPVERWKERSSCPGIRFEASTEKHQNEGFQIVGGQITYTGTRPVKEIRVCASGICQMVRQEPMTQGASEKFSIKSPSLETPVVTAQCSVLIE